MRRPGIPDVPRSFDPSQRDFLYRIKESIETSSGRRGGRIGELPSGASLDDVIRKINELISTLQG
jgi:hypothetical protein